MRSGGRDDGRDENVGPAGRFAQALGGFKDERLAIFVLGEPTLPPFTAGLGREWELGRARGGFTRERDTLKLGACPSTIHPPNIISSKRTSDAHRAKIASRLVEEAPEGGQAVVVRSWESGSSAWNKYMNTSPKCHGQARRASAPK